MIQPMIPPVSLSVPVAFSFVWILRPVYRAYSERPTLSSEPTTEHEQACGYTHTDRPVTDK